MRHGLRIFIVILLVVLLVLAGLVLSGCSQVAQPPEAKATATPASDTQAETISAEGKVVPVQQARLSFKIGGRVSEIKVTKGEQVSAGQVLIKLDAGEQENAVRQAETALATARAELAKTKAGARAEQIAVAETQVAEAKAGLAAARAGLATAQAYLDRLLAGANERQLEIARQRWEQAKNLLYGTQAQRDTIGALRDSPHGPSKGTFEMAQASVQQAEQGVRIAELQYEDLKAGATPEEVAILRAQVVQATREVEVAQAHVSYAQANLDLVKAGASAEDLAIAESRVVEAEAGLATARTALENTTLVAPFAGTITDLPVNLGEVVAPGQSVAVLADLAHLQVETTDFGELHVARISVGQPVQVTVDALGKTFRGKVTQVANQATLKSGEVNYTVTIVLDEIDPALRWGMTVKVDFGRAP